MKKILIIDDEEDLVNITAIRLKRWGYLPVKAYSAKEALKILKTNPPDLIMLDLMMPDMNGYELCKKIRSREKTKNIPVIIFTASSELDKKNILDKTRADILVLKPLDPEELKDKLLKLLK